MIDGKKVLLVLGAISVLNEIVINARKKGYYVIVADYYEHSPAKKYADETWLVSIDDVETIVQKAKERHVDGVMNYCIDPGQKPYQQICEKLGLPCVAGFEQFDIMTNKDKFASCCEKFGIGTVPEYSHEGSLPKDIIPEIKYPVVVKPVDGRASKGISVVHSQEDLESAVAYALSFSKRKKIIVQKYMKCPETAIKYIACNGEFFLTSMSDMFDCILPDGTRVYIGTQTYPSRFFPEYIRTTSDRVINMLKSIGIKNGAMSLTGFYDNGIFRFIDPSLRMGGAEDWNIVKAASGVDISELLTNFAMAGSMGNPDDIRRIDKAIATRYSALLYFDLMPGIIGTISGIEEALKFEGVVSHHECHVPGDEIADFGTSDNVAVRFVLSCDSKNALVELMKKIQSIVAIEDINGRNMLAPLFNPDILLTEEK